MDCEAIRNRLADCVIGDGFEDGDSRGVPEDIRAHLAACAPCREEAEALVETWTALGTIAFPSPDSATMRRRFDAMLNSYLRDDPTQDGRAQQTAWTAQGTRWFWEGRAVSAAAAAVLLLVTGGLAGGRWQAVCSPAGSAGPT